MPFIDDPTTVGTAFSDLVSEFVARGFDFLDEDRAKLFVNQSYLEVVDAELWPFREADTSGAPPLSVVDLGPIATVVDTANSDQHLTWVDRRTLVDRYGDLTTTGTPWLYYLPDQNTIAVFPVGDQISVHYWAVPPTLMDDDDMSIVPDRFMDIIIDGAVRRGHQDRSNFPAAEAVEQERLRKLDRMREVLMGVQYSGPDYVVQTDHADGGSWGDY